MSEIPKIARARLERLATGAGSHPDADQLTAFLERSLGAREREQVLEHLARCAECREVVAVALPPPEEAARAAQPAPRFRWLPAWGGLRWAAVAATFVIAVSLIFQTYQRAPETSSRETAENRPVAATAPTETAPPEEPARAEQTQPPASGGSAAKAKASTTSTVAVVRDQETGAANGPSKLDSVARAKTAEAGVGAGLAGGRVDDSKKLGSEGKVKAETGGGMLAAKPAAPPAPAMAASKRGPAAPSAQQQQVAGLAQQAPSVSPAAKEELKGQLAAEPASRAAADQAESAKISAQNEAVSTQSAEKDADQRARNAAAPAAGFGEARKMSAAATMRWVITAQGLVQRSLDNGRTWKSVRLDSHIHFRAVSASGSEVWAGGQGGALYHSSDSGDHWTRVALPPELASATIVRVEFTDAQHGTLANSTGETWATSDAGTTWQKK